jgi:P27 family predicted phage terminase small subunit
MTKTRQQKQASGTLEKRRDKTELSFDPLTELPEPMDQLSETGIEFYNRIGKILLSNGILTDADIVPLTEASGWWEIRCKMKGDINKNGCIQETQSGYTQKTASVQVLFDATRILDAFYKAYGLSFASRSKLNMPKKEKKNALLEIADK